MNERYEEHLNRVMMAVRGEKPDRIPTIASGSALNAVLTGLSIAQYCADMPANCQANLKGVQMYQDPDGVQVTIYSPWCLSFAWLGKALVPGVHLGENDLWQMDEQGTVTVEDYDEILQTGYKPWLDKVYRERLGNPAANAADFFAYTPVATQIFADAGYPCFMGAALAGPIEQFCGGRTLMNFFGEDLFEIPDLVEKVFDQVQAENMEDWKAMFSNPEAKPVGVWVGGWRGTPDLLSPDMFERFAWRYTKEIIELCIEYDVVPLMHLDSNWDNGIKYFKELPAHTCILGLDGMTDIFKAAEELQGYQCLMGDVPATMLSFGTPEEVDAYCEKLIREVGPTSYIMSAGCDAPPNAKLENMKALADSVFKYPI